MPRRRTPTPSRTAERFTVEDALAGLELDFADDDTSSLGHLMLREQRKLLYYLRLIEHEMPKLVGERYASLDIPHYRLLF
jgi:small subunit ribosomal protein S35